MPVSRWLSVKEKRVCPDSPLPSSNPTLRGPRVAAEGQSSQQAEQHSQWVVCAGGGREGLRSEGYVDSGPASRAGGKPGEKLVGAFCECVHDVRSVYLCGPPAGTPRPSEQEGFSWDAGIPQQLLQRPCHHLTCHLYVLSV